MTPDERGLRALRSRLRDPTAIRAVAAFSRAGEHGACWLALGAAGAALDAPRRAAWRDGMATVAVAYLVNTAVKVAVGRPRPRMEGLPALVETPSRLSFPSAHASTSFAGARAYGRLGAPVALHLVAFALVTSRVALGVHYPSDVLAGALLGRIVAR